MYSTEPGWCTRIAIFFSFKAYFTHPIQFLCKLPVVGAPPCSRTAKLFKSSKHFRAFCSNATYILYHNHISYMANSLNPCANPPHLQACWQFSADLIKISTFNSSNHCVLFKGAPWKGITFWGASITYIREIFQSYSPKFCCNPKSLVLKTFQSSSI